MSFQNYDTFNQAGQPDASGGGPAAPAQQDPALAPQVSENAPGQFPAGNGGDPGSAGGQQQGGDAKTTLWYVLESIFLFSFHPLLVAHETACHGSLLDAKFKDMEVGL